MQYAMWFASVFGPLLLILGVWMVFYRDNMNKVQTSIKTNPGILYVLAIINLVFGLTIVNCYNEWVGNITILVTLLGWLFLVHGICCLFFPQLVVKQWIKNKHFSIRGLVGLVWGLLLCWFAFWAQ